MTTLIWYIIIAEFITYAGSAETYRNISEMIKNGEVANMLIRPVNFVGYIISQQSGVIIKIAVNACGAIILGLVFAGTISITLTQLIFVVIASLFGLMIQLFIHSLIGIIAMLTEENKAFYLILGKLQLLLVFTPLEFFSSNIQKVLAWLPTTYIVYPPSRLLVNFNTLTGIELMIKQIISFLFIFCMIIFVYRKGVKKINVNGG